MHLDRIENIFKLQLEWIKTADSKVPPIFAINMAMLGFMATLIKSVVHLDMLAMFFLFISFFLLLTSTMFLGFVVYPRLNTNVDSNIYFGGIVSQDESSYSSVVENLSESDYQDDLLRQSYETAKIARIKFDNVKRAFTLTFMGVPFWLVSIYCLYL